MQFTKLFTDRFDDDEPIVTLRYKKFNLEQQSVINDAALIGKSYLLLQNILCYCQYMYCTLQNFTLFTLGPSTVSSFDYLREACVLGGHDTTIRSGPSPEARLIVVGEQHRIALFRVNKVIQQLAEISYTEFKTVNLYLLLMQTM